MGRLVVWDVKEKPADLFEAGG